MSRRRTNRHTTNRHTTLGTLLAYPAPGYPERAARAAEGLAERHSPAAEALSAFARAVADRDDAGMEELYTRTFDLDPACALEVGWHLWGEDYERGRFLVAARGLLRRLGLPEEGELPDHLRVLLPAFDRLPEGEAGAWAVRYLIPSVTVMLRILERKQHPYRHLLAAVRDALEETAAALPEEERETLAAQAPRPRREPVGATPPGAPATGAARRPIRDRLPVLQPGPARPPGSTHLEPPAAPGPSGAPEPPAGDTP